MSASAGLREELDTRVHGLARRPERPTGPGATLLAATTLVIVLAPVIAVGWIGTTGDLVLDDFSLYGLARSYSLPNIEYLTSSWFGHVMPAGLLAMWVESRAFGLDKTWYGITQAAGMLATMALLSGLLRKLIPGWAVVIPLGFFASSMSVIAATAWWANAMWVIPVMVTTLLCIRAMVSADSAEQAQRATYWCLGYLATGLAFSEKAALLPVGLFVIDLARRREPIIVAARATWTVWRRLWLASAAILVCYLGLFLWANDRAVLGHSPFGVQPEQPTDFVVRVWSNGLPAGVLGGPVDWMNVLLAGPPPIFYAYSRALLVLLAALCLLNVAGRRLLLWFVIYLSGTAYLMAAGRFVGVDGFLTLMQVRYYADSVLWFTLALAFALAATSRSRDVGAGGFRRATSLLLAAWLLVTGGLWTRSVAGLVEAYRNDAVEPVATGIRETLRAVRQLPEGTQVLNTPLRATPFTVVTDNTGRVLKMSDVYGALAPHVRFVDGMSKPLLYRGEGVFSHTRAIGHFAKPRPAVCVSSAEPRASIQLPALLFPNFHQIDAVTTPGEAGAARVALDAGPGGVLDKHAGQTSVSTWVEGGSDAVELTWLAGGPVCIDHLTVGPPEELDRDVAR